MGATDDEIQQYDGLEPSSKFLLNGQLSGFSGQGCKNVTCKWHLQTDWTIRGKADMLSGTTQISQPANAHLSDYCCWGHPLELELECHKKTEQGWPKLVLEVSEIQHAVGWSGGGRATPLAYAVVPLPCSQGTHNLCVPCMRVYLQKNPRDSSAWFGGIRPALASLEFVHNSEERTVLGHHTHTPVATEAAGFAHLQLNILIGSKAGREEVSGTPGNQNPAERRAERLLATRLKQLSSAEPLERFTSGLELVRKNKSIYMKAAQQRLQARDSEHPGDTIPGGMGRGVDVMEPASAGILQSSGSVDIQNGHSEGTA